MKIACGYLRWRPCDFWEATPHELVISWRGFVEYKSAGKSDTMQDMQEVKDLYDAAKLEELKGRLRDHG